MVELGEPPFLPGTMSPELAQQRADQCTAYFLSQLLCTEDFHKVVDPDSRMKKSPARWKHVLGYLLMATLIFAAFWATSDLGGHADGLAAATPKCNDDGAQRVVTELVNNTLSLNRPLPSPQPAAAETSDELLHPPINSPTDSGLRVNTSTSMSPPTNETTSEATGKAKPVGAVPSATDPAPTDFNAAPVGFTPASACSLVLFSKCNERAPAPKPRPQAGQASASRDSPSVILAEEKPVQQLPRSGLTRSVLTRAIAIFAQIMMVTLAATLLSHFAIKYFHLGLAFFTCNVTMAAHGAPEHARQQPDSSTPPVAVEPPSPAPATSQPTVAQIGAMRSDDGPNNSPMASEVPVRVTLAQPKSEVHDDFESAACTHDDDAYIEADQPASPLLYAPLLSAAASQAKPLGRDTSFGRGGSPTPNAMNMLTPAEPPSPFPGFPALSSFASSGRPADDPACCDQTSVGIPRDLPSTADAGPTQPTAYSSALSEADGAPSPAAQDSDAATWSSSAPSLDAGDVSNGQAAATPGSHGVVPCQFVRLLDADAPGSCSASFAIGSVQHQDAESASAIFDLSRFDEDGEEVISLSSLAQQNPVTSPGASLSAAGSVDVRVEETGQADSTAVGLPRCPAPKRLLAARKATPYAKAHDSDVFSLDAGATPTWPPKPAEDLGLLDDVDEGLISYEALSLFKSLVGGSSSSPSAAPPGDPLSTAYERAHSPSETGAGGRDAHQPCQEPGRDYAAVAAAASVLLAGFKSSAKSVLLAACAGDESTLRSAQGELYAAFSQLREMDLAPHSYTAGACKLLQYSTAATPNWGMPSPGSGSSGVASWASIGSRVLSSGAGQPPPAAIDASSAGPYSDATDGVSMTPAPPALYSPSSREAWASGPVPLPQNIDGYLEARRNLTSPSSAHVLADLQDGLATAGLIITTAASEIWASREAAAAAQAATSVWRQRAANAEARNATELEAVAEDLSGWHAAAGRDRGEDVWVCVDVPSHSAAVSSESDSVTDAVQSDLVMTDAGRQATEHAVAPTDDTPDVEPVDAIITVIQELVSVVVESSEQRDAGMVTNKERVVVSVDSVLNVSATDVTVAARGDMYGSSPPASLRSGSGSCAGVDKTFPGPYNSNAALSGVGSRIGPLGPSSPMTPPFARRMETAFDTWGDEGVASSPAASYSCSTVRALWRPQVSPSS